MFLRIVWCAVVFFGFVVESSGPLFSCRFFVDFGFSFRLLYSLLWYSWHCYCRVCFISLCYDLLVHIRGILGSI